MSTARYRERHSTSKAKSDSGDAHILAEIVRLDTGHHRPIAGDSDQGEAMKLVARSHQSMIWDRTRHVLRLRSALREYFVAARTGRGEVVGLVGSDPAGRARTTAPARTCSTCWALVVGVGSSSRCSPHTFTILFRYEPYAVTPIRLMQGVGWH
jgi:hypothetical protein